VTPPGRLLRRSILILHQNLDGKREQCILRQKETWQLCTPFPSPSPRKKKHPFNMHLHYYRGLYIAISKSQWFKSEVETKKYTFGPQMLDI